MTSFSYLPSVYPPLTAELAERIMSTFTRSRRLAYALLSPTLIITKASANFGGFFVGFPSPLTGCALFDLVWEFAGAEEHLKAVMRGDLPFFELEHINRTQADGSPVYLSFRVFRLDESRPDSGLLLLVEDMTQVGRITQHLTQERNELRLIRSELSLANLKLERLAATDELTGLANRRRFDAELARELERVGRYKHSLALLMIDVDNFKGFNDAYGHPAGDARLKQLAAVLRANLRRLDVPARYGGEEFAVILPETHLTPALIVAERLRDACARAALDAQPHSPLTISLGLAVAPLHATTAAELLDAADQALYRAKHAGKNQVSVYDAQG